MAVIQKRQSPQFGAGKSGDATYEHALEGLLCQVAKDIVAAGFMTVPVRITLTPHEDNWTFFIASQWEYEDEKPAAD